MSDTSTPDHPARSAARTAYEIIEIRREILRLLFPADLATFMRVEKGCMRDVAGMLYRTVRFEKVEVPMSNVPIRQEIYASSVVEVDARSMIVSAEMQEDTRWKALVREEGCDQPILWVRYSPKVFDIVVPFLRHTLSGLRRVRFGRNPSAKSGADEADREPSCTVSLHPPPTHPSLQEAAGPIGALDIRLRRDLPLKHKPPKSITPPAKMTPSGPYLLRYRYDIRLRGPSSAKSGRGEEWINALLDGRYFDQMSSCIAIEHLPITIDQLAILCERRIAHNPSHRFEKIKVISFLPCGLDQFRRFAAIASTSLTTLVLINGMATPVTRESSISCRDLPVLLPLIRERLPNLITLKLEIDGLDEDQAAPLLSRNCLDSKGTITDLQIASDDSEYQYFHTPAFNIVRVLACICAPDATLALIPAFDGKYGPGSEGSVGQTNYLRYLRRQPQRCRHHLATADFELLGLESLEEVRRLNYDQDGRPFLPQKSRPWTQEKSMIHHWKKTSSPPLWSTVDEYQTGIETHYEALRQLDKLALAPAWEKLAKAQFVLEEAEALRAMARRLVEGVDVEGVRQYIQSLKLQLE